MRPVPQFLYHVERFDSENTGTAVAQTGRAISPVPSSQRVWNARWHKWLEQPSSPVGSHVAVEGSQRSLKNTVSPGVSEIRQPVQDAPPSSPLISVFMPSEPNQTVVNGPPDLSKLPTSSDSSEILSRYEELVARLRRLEEFDIPVPLNQPSESITVVSAEKTTADRNKGHGEGMVSLASSHVQEERSEPITVESQGQGNPAASDIRTSKAENMPAKPSSSQPPLAVQQAPTELDAADLDDAWKTFVFGDEQSDEVRKEAFEEAKHDAVQSFQPSNPRNSSYEGHESDESNVATVGTLHTGHGNKKSLSTETPSSAGPSASVRVAHAPSFTGTESWPVVDPSDDYTQAPSIEANAGTSSLSGFEHVADISESNGPVSAEDADSGTSHSLIGAPSMTTSIMAAPAQSEVEPSVMGTSGEQFRFAQPKLFVGSRSNLTQPKRSIEPSVGISLAKRRRGRPKKRANDGRTDIRALPNYSSDPIEEFEDEAWAGEAGNVPKSLFPSLELA